MDVLHFPVYTSDVFPHLSPTELSMLPLLFYFWQPVTAQHSARGLGSHEGRTILAALLFVGNWSRRKVWGCGMTWCSALVINQHSEIIRNDCLNCPVCMQVCVKQSWDFLTTFFFLKTFLLFKKLTGCFVRAKWICKMPPNLCWKASMARLQGKAGLAREFW